jgi:hypothetical protein
MRNFMIGRIAFVASATVAPLMLLSAAARAQDVPGIEICTVEKTMERRTSCLQSNVDFLQKTITKLSADHRRPAGGAEESGGGSEEGERTAGEGRRPADQGWRQVI